MDLCKLRWHVEQQHSLSCLGCLRCGHEWGFRLPRVQRTRSDLAKTHACTGESVVWLLCTICYESKTSFDIGGHNVPHSCANVNVPKIDTLIYLYRCINKHICGWEHMPRRDITCIGLNGHSITSKSNSSALDAPESETAKDWNLRRRVSRKE